MQVAIVAVVTPEVVAADNLVVPAVESSAALSFTTGIVDGVLKLDSDIKSVYVAEKKDIV